MTARCSTSWFTVPSNSASGNATAFLLAPAAESCWASIMTAPASLLADRDEAVHRTRHRPAHEQQIPLGVDLDDPKAELREVAGAQVSGHPLALDDPRRVRARRDRARLAMPRVAVGFGAAAEVMAVHDALKAAAFRDAAHLHAVAFGEDRDGHRGAGGRRVTDDGEALDQARRDLEARLFHVPQHRFRAACGLLRAAAARRRYTGAAEARGGARPSLGPPFFPVPRPPLRVACAFLRADAELRPAVSD